MNDATTLRETPVDQVGDDPSGVLAATGQELGAVRTYVVELDAGGRVGRCHEWSAPGVAKRGDVDAVAPRSLHGLGLAPWADRVLGGASVVDGFGEPARAGRDELARHGVTSIARVPVEFEGEVRGLVGADLRADASSTRPSPAPEAILLALRTLSSAVARDAMLRRLRDDRGFAIDLLAALPGGILVTNANSRVQYVNPAAAQILGYGPYELLALSADELMDDDEAERLRPIRARRRTGQVTTYEVRVRHKNGSPRDLMITGAPRFRDGTFIGTLSTLVDITSSKLAAQEMARAQEVAERAKEATSLLVSQLGHELRTPLNSVLGYARLLTTDDLSADQRESVAEIIRAGEHMVGLIDAAFDVASIEAKGVPLDLRPVPLRALVQEVVSMVRVLARPAGVQIAIDTPRKGPHVVMADRTRLKQVIVNILANAVKYSRPPGMVVLACGVAAPVAVPVAAPRAAPMAPLSEAAASASR